MSKMTSKPSKSPAFNAPPLRWLAFALSLLFIGSLCPDVLAKSASLKAGLNHYTRGEFTKAAPALQKALKGPLSRSDKVKAYKFLGLSLFTLGKLTEAEQSFKRCLDLDEGCSVHKDEALDESVLPFFKQIRDGASPAAGQPAVPEANAAPLATTQPQSPPSTPVATGSGPEGATRVLIQSNASGASVLIDGILAGNVGSPIGTVDGTVEVEVVAEGYKSRQLKLAVSKGTLNTFQIDLAPDREREKDKERDRREVREGREKDRKPTSSRKGRRGGRDDSLDDVEIDLKDDFGSGGDEPVNFGRRDSGKTKTKPLSFIHVLPLGAGQLINGDYLLAGGIAAAQAYFAHSIFAAEQNITTARNNLEAEISRARSDSGLSQGALKDFTEDTNVYIKDEQDTQTTYIFALAGTYAFGVVHAILYRPEIPQKSTLLPEEEPGLHWTLERSTPKKLEVVLQWNF